MIPGVCQKNGRTYRRFKVKNADGKWVDQYVKLPDPSDPTFAEALARVNGKAPERARPPTRHDRGADRRAAPVLAKRDMATRRARLGYYLGLIEEQHGKRLVADLERSHCYRIRDGMADEPGKANNYMAKFKALLEFGAERGWIKDNPASGHPAARGRRICAVAAARARRSARRGFADGSAYHHHRPLLGPARERCDPHPAQVRRRHDRAAQQENLDGRRDPDAPAVARRDRQDRSQGGDGPLRSLGPPFASPGTIQARIRRLMKRLGYVDEEGVPLYSSTGSARTRSAT
jgi:hypothetical protein